MAFDRRQLKKNAMSIDSSRDRLLKVLTEWRKEPLVVEFRAGPTRVSGICVLVNVSDTELRFVFDPSVRPNCEVGIFLDDSIATFRLGSFEDAVENILGKPLHALTAQESHAFFSKGVEQVADVRFLRGGRLIIGFLKAGLGSAQANGQME